MTHKAFAIGSNNTDIDHDLALDPTEVVRTLAGVTDMSPHALYVRRLAFKLIGRLEMEPYPEFGIVVDFSLEDLAGR